MDGSGAIVDIVVRGEVLAQLLGTDPVLAFHVRNHFQALTDAVRHHAVYTVSGEGILTSITATQMAGVAAGGAASNGIHSEFAGPDTATALADDVVTAGRGAAGELPVSGVAHVDAPVHGPGTPASVRIAGHVAAGGTDDAESSGQAHHLRQQIVLQRQKLRSTCCATAPHNVSSTRDHIHNTWAMYILPHLF